MKRSDLKKIRETLKMTQEQLGKELDRSERFVNYRETGDRPICKMMARALRDLQNNPMNTP